MIHTKDQKIRQMMQDGRKLYHTQDLAVLWGTRNPNTTYMTASRYMKRGFLRKIHKGFYATVPLEKIDPVRLGLAALHRYAYVSTESVLAAHGIIFQELQAFTFVSDISKKFSLGGHRFFVRAMKEEFLFNDEGVTYGQSVREASVERALADLLYFNPQYHIDAHEKVDWDRVREIQHRVGYL